MSCKAQQPVHKKIKMEASISDELRSYSKPVLQSHLDLLDRGTLSDVISVVGPSKERIPCHQVFLVARSPVFEIMFSERWNQVKKNTEIPIENVDPKIFKKFLQFIYADTVVANLPEALELLQVAHTYDVQLLVSRCEELLLEKEVPLNDALDVFLAARKYQMVQLMDKAVYSMAKWLPQLRSHPSFSRMDKETLIYILQSNRLNIREIDLFRLALKWAKSQSDLTLEQSMEDILPLIRFPVMSLEEFARTVVPTGLLPQSTLVEIFTYFGADAETKKSMASKLKFSTQRRRLIDSVHYFDLYSGDLARKQTELLQLEKLVDSIQISTHITGTTAMGIDGISVYCPARMVGTAFRPASSTFQEFSLVLKRENLRVKRGPSYKNLLVMSPVRAEEGKMTEIKFDTLVPLENDAQYRITIEEIQTTSTQLAASGEVYYVAKAFGRIRNCELNLNIINDSVVIESKRQNEQEEGLGDHYEHPQLICRLGLEKL